MRIPDEGMGTIPTKELVTIDQKRENGTASVGNVGRALGSFLYYPAPFDLYLLRNSTQKFKASQGLFTSPYEKYHHWREGENNIADVVNHRTFTILTQQQPLTGQLATTFNASVQAQLLEGGSVGGSESFTFKNPWYPDDNSDPLGLRNRGTNPIPHAIPDAESNIGISSQYQGVFLQQSGPPQWNPPYYSIGAPLQTTINGWESYFMYWSGDPDFVSYRSPDKDTSAVVFKFSGASALAQYKAHLGASSPSALSTNQQRKVELVGFNNLWLTYESANQVWSLTSTNFGTTWGAEQLLSTNGGTNKNPSTGSRFFGQPYIVWHGLNGGVNTIWVKTPFATSPHEVATTGVHGTIAAAPVVGEHEYASGGGNCGPFTSYLEPFVAWTASGGVQVHTSSDLGNTWYSAFSLSNFFRPSFTSGSSTHLSFDNGSAVYLMSRVTTTGSILPLILEPDERECYQTFWTSSEMVPGSRSPQTVFSGNSQVSGVLYDGAALVSWQMHEDLSLPGAEEPQAEEMNAVPTQEEVTDQICTDIYSVGVQRAEYDAVRQRYVWHPAAKFSSCSPYTLPTVSSYSAGGAILLWTSGSHVLQATSDDAGIKWSSISNLSDGGNPNLAFGSNKYIYSELTGPPYRLNLGESSSMNFRGGIAGEGTREIGFGSGNAWLSVEMPQMVIKTTHGEMIPIPFAVSDDSAFLPTADNLEEYLKTARMLIPEDADSLFFGLLVRSKNAVGLTTSGVPVRLHLRFTPNYGTSRYTAARWRLERNHNLNRMFRLPVAALRGRTIEFSVTLQGIERTRENLYANALVKHRPESPSQNSPMSKPAGEGSLLAGLPTDFGLAQNFPNPFNPTTVIKYQLPRDSHVTLKVFDVLGREIKVLVEGTKQAGYHEVSLDASQLASGMYMYALKAGEFTSVKKLILLR